MKNYSKLLIALGLIMAAMGTQSCMDKDSNDVLNKHKALVTVRSNEQGWYMQLDENNILKAVNKEQSPYGDREVRAIIYYDLVDDMQKSGTTEIQLNYIDSVLTKNTVPYISKENAESYGDDAIDIIKDWVTIAEDGYLTLRVRSFFSGNRAHRINLLYNENDPDNPYSYELRHDADGDWGYASDAIVAFKLDGIPYPLTQDVKLKLSWMSSYGPKNVEFVMKAPNQ